MYSGSAILYVITRGIHNCMGVYFAKGLYQVFIQMSIPTGWHTATVIFISRIYLLRTWAIVFSTQADFVYITYPFLPNTQKKPINSTHTKKKIFNIRRNHHVSFYVFYTKILSFWDTVQKQQKKRYFMLTEIFFFFKYRGPTCYYI